MAHEKRLELGTQLGEAKLERPDRELGLRRIEQLLFGPLAGESEPVTSQGRDSLQGDGDGLGEQPSGLVIGGVECDELTMDKERVLMAIRGRKPVALDELELLGAMSHAWRSLARRAGWNAVLAAAA